MFKNTLELNIKKLLFNKDNEINNNYILLNQIFNKYINKEVDKDYLLNEHSYRNKLFIEWKQIYLYYY